MLGVYLSQERFISCFQGDRRVRVSLLHWLFRLSRKESACNAGDLGSVPGLGRSPGEGNSDPSSILAWTIPWAEEPWYSPRGLKVLDTTEWLILSLFSLGNIISMPLMHMLAWPALGPNIAILWFGSNSGLVGGWCSVGVATFNSRTPQPSPRYPANFWLPGAAFLLLTVFPVMEHPSVQVHFSSLDTKGMGPEIGKCWQSPCT